MGKNVYHINDNELTSLITNVLLLIRKKKKYSDKSIGKEPKEALKEKSRRPLNL